MMVYDVIGKIKDMDNMDRIDEIFRRPHFQTSIETKDIKESRRKSSIEIYKMGELALYSHLKDVYKL